MGLGTGWLGPRPDCAGLRPNWLAHGPDSQGLSPFWVVLRTGGLGLGPGILGLFPCWLVLGLGWLVLPKGDVQANVSKEIPPLYRALFPIWFPNYLKLFSDASMHLYKRVCPSVRPSVGWLVGWPVMRFFLNCKNEGFSSCTVCHQGGQGTSQICRIHAGRYVWWSVRLSSN